MAIVSAFTSGFGLFPRRQQPATDSERQCPFVVLPRRQCVTAGVEGSTDLAEFGKSVFAFFDRIFTTPSSLMRQVPLKQKLFAALPNPKVNADSFRAAVYPPSRVHGGRDLPLIVYEFDWEEGEGDVEGSRSPSKCFSFMRKMYFAEDAMDDEGTFHFLERLPDSPQSCVSNQVVFEYVWDRNPRKGFAMRDWVEYIAVDEESKTIFERSCLHPLRDEAERRICGCGFPSPSSPPLFSAAAVASPSTFFWTLLNATALFIVDVLGILFPIGTVRARALSAIRFLPPRQGKSGCRVQQIAWNSMGGVPDALMGCVPALWEEYVSGISRQFCRLDEFMRRSDAGQKLPSIPFDLCQKKKD